MLVEQRRHKHTQSISKLRTLRCVAYAGRFLGCLTWGKFVLFHYATTLYPQLWTKQRQHCRKSATQYWTNLWPLGQNSIMGTFIISRLLLVHSPRTQTGRTVYSLSTGCKTQTVEAYVWQAFVCAADLMRTHAAHGMAPCAARTHCTHSLQTNVRSDDECDGIHWLWPMSPWGVSEYCLCRVRKYYGKLTARYSEIVSLTRRDCGDVNAVAFIKLLMIWTVSQVSDTRVSHWTRKLFNKLACFGCECWYT